MITANHIALLELRANPKAYIYWAAPLFNTLERNRNKRRVMELEQLGYRVFLPQRDAGEARKGKSRKEIYDADVQAVKGCSLLIACIDGRVPDEGTVFEMGLATAWSIPVLIYSDDARSFMDGHLNVMLEHTGIMFNKFNDLLGYLKEVETGYQIMLEGV